MPAEGLEWLERDELLSFEEIERLVRVLARMGVDEVRLTGGEPLVRRDLPTLVGMLAATPGVRDLSLTTNGVLLDRFAAPLVEAGLRRLNVSLDSLSHVRFAEITRRDALDRAALPLRGRRGRDGFRQSGLGAVRLDLRPDPAAGRRTAPHLPLFTPRMGPEDTAPRRLLRRAAGRADPLRGRPQGAQAQDQRSGFCQSQPLHVPNRRVAVWPLFAGNFARAARRFKID